MTSNTWFVYDVPSVANSKSSMVEKVHLETASLEVFVWKRDNDGKPKFTRRF